MHPRSVHPLPRCLALLLVAVLALGCAVTPQSPKEGIAAASTAVETMAESVVTARDAGYLSDAEAQTAKARLQRAADMIKAAKAAIFDGNEAQAKDLLSRARSVIGVVRATLEASQ